MSEFQPDHPDHSCSSANKISDQQASAFESPVITQASVGNSDSIYEQEERKNIILVDNIQYPVQFIKSSSILAEVKKYAPTVQVKYAYSLAKGGVAIHLNNTEDKHLLLQSLTQNHTAFGGGKVSDLSDKRDSAFIINVSTQVGTDSVKAELEKVIRGKGVKKTSHCDIKAVQRLTSHNSGRPLPVIKVIGSSTVISSLIQAKDIIVVGKVCSVERRKPVIYRCYNCQSFGHIAKVCNRQKRCINCGRSHTNDGYCTAPVACANCNGPHRSSSRDCPEFKRNYENFTGKCQKFEYNKRSAGTHVTGSSSRLDVAAGDLECQRKSAAEGLHDTTG